MAKGYGNVEVPEIDPKRDGYCHPAHSQRTKCACGKSIELSRPIMFCPQCRRVHRKRPGVSSFAETGLQPVRPGGKRGCPGVAGGNDASEGE